MVKILINAFIWFVILYSLFNIFYYVILPRSIKRFGKAVERKSKYDSQIEEILKEENK